MATLETSLEANYDGHRTDGQEDKATYRGTSYRSAQKHYAYYIVQILHEYCHIQNIVQYCANISQILSVHHPNIVRISKICNKYSLFLYL